MNVILASLTFQPGDAGRRGAKVHGHITGKSKPTGDDDEDWEAIDSRIKSWFYSTCDANLLQIISSDNCTAKDL
ncbi:hypothetical protein OSB04_un000972 [Centaurea solstitialis]|uniref:Uncharacterized protein n=1 Tax=Centaurea solstitialis TaxID=347529 RepID=A0AA38S4W8_9ASTR|nr:hypothetical protein OSB04_un000972 [Centaurea solstitialis]